MLQIENDDFAARLVWDFETPQPIFCSHREPTSRRCPLVTPQLMKLPRALHSSTLWTNTLRNIQSGLLHCFVSITSQSLTEFSRLPEVSVGCRKKENSPAEARGKTMARKYLPRKYNYLAKNKRSESLCNPPSYWRRIGKVQYKIVNEKFE